MEDNIPDTNLIKIRNNFCNSDHIIGRLLKDRNILEGKYQGTYKRDGRLMKLLHIINS